MSRRQAAVSTEKFRFARGERSVSQLLAVGRASMRVGPFPGRLLGRLELSPTTFWLPYHRGQPWAPVVDAPTTEPPGDDGLGPEVATRCSRQKWRRGWYGWRIVNSHVLAG